MKIKLSSRPPAPKAAPELTTEDLKSLAVETLSAQEAALKPDDFEVYLRALFDECTERLGTMNGKQIAAQRREEVDAVDADAILSGLRDGTQNLDHLQRIDLVAVAQALGAADTDTRGKPVKALRELVKARLEAEEIAPPMTKVFEAVAKGQRPVVKKAVFKMPRRSLQ
jgi:hypothetical protein